MKKLFLIAFVLIGIFAEAQPGYTRINSRYSWLGGMFDAFNLPGVSTPALATAQQPRAGAMVYDSTGGNRGVHVYTGSAWVKLYDTLMTVGSFNTSIGSGFKIGVDGTNNIKSFTATNGLTADSLTAGQVGVKLGGRLTEFTSIDADGNDFQIINGPGILLEASTDISGVVMNKFIGFGNTSTAHVTHNGSVLQSYITSNPSAGSSVIVAPINGISLQTDAGKLFIDTLLRSSSSGDSVLVKETGTGQIKTRAQSALGGSQGLQSVITNDPVLTTNNVIDFTGNNFHLIADGAAGTENLNLGAWRTNVYSTGVSGNYINIQSHYGTGMNNQITVSDSIVIQPYQGKLNIDSLRSGYTDTTLYKPLARKSTGDIVQMNSWAQVSGGGGSGNVTKVGTPVNNQVGIWTGDGTIEGDADLTFDGTLLTANSITMSGTGTTGAVNLTNAASDFVIGNGVSTATFRLLPFGSDIYFDNPVVGSQIFRTNSVERIRLDVNGLSVGTSASPTARLHIAAGTTSAGTSPIKVNAGPVTTTAVAGQIERPDAFTMTKSNDVRYGVGGTLNSQFTDVGNVGTGVDDLMTYTIPAGTLSQDGDRLEVTMALQLSTANNKHIKVHWGASEFDFYNSVTTGIVFVNIIITRKGSASQIISFQATGGSITSPYNDLVVDTKDFTGAIVLKATGEATTNNDINMRQMTVKFFPAN